MRIDACFRSLCCIVLLAAAGCGSDGGQGPSAGGIQISIEATGVDVDLVPFMVVVDGMEPRVVWAERTVCFLDLAPGSYTVRMEATPDNCQVVGPTTRTVTVIGGEDVHSTFSATCDAVVEGSWDYTLSINLGAPCTITADLSLNQAHSSFGGTAKNCWITCPNTDVDEALPDAHVRSGTSNQAGVAFQFDDSRISHSGTYSGSMMSGEVVFQFPDLDRTGQWSATRTFDPLLDRQMTVGQTAAENLSSPGGIVARIRAIADETRR